jgi:hypothetical protein
MSYYWTTKLNDATSRRIEKLERDDVQIDTDTHTGRQVIGYNYLQLAFNKSKLLLIFPSLDLKSF